MTTDEWRAVFKRLAQLAIVSYDNGEFSHAIWSEHLRREAETGEPHDLGAALLRPKRGRMGGV